MSVLLTKYFPGLATRTHRRRPTQKHIKQGTRELRILVGAALALAMSASITATAHEGASGVVKERMDDMETIGQQVKIMVPMLKGTLPYDPTQVATSAGIIERHSGDSFTKLFPEDSTGKPSEALPEIWDEWEKFSDIASELELSANALKTVAVNNGSVDDFKAALGAMLKTCKSCHSSFRE